MTRRFLRRSSKGQGIVEGTVGVCMIFGGSALALLLLINSGTGMLFKEKLSYAGHMAANYAAAHAGDSDVQSKTTSFVQELMPQMGLYPNNLSVTVTGVNIQTSTGIQVTLTNSFPLFGGSGGVLPALMKLSDTEVVVW